MRYQAGFCAEPAADATVKAGWIRRDRPADNRREVYAVLTDEGRTLLRTALPAYLGALQEMIADQLARADLAALLDLSGSCWIASGPTAARATIRAENSVPGSPPGRP